MKLKTTKYIVKQHDRFLIVWEGFLFYFFNQAGNLGTVFERNFTFNFQLKLVKNRTF